MVKHALFPAAEVGAGEVAVDAPDAGGAVAGDFCEETGDDLGGDVVPVNEKSQVVGVADCHFL